MLVKQKFISGIPFDPEHGYSESFSQYVFQHIDHLLLDLERSIETCELKKLRHVDGEIKFLADYFELTYLKDYVKKVESRFSNALFIPLNEIEQLVIELKVLRKLLWEESVEQDSKAQNGCTCLGFKSHPHCSLSNI